MNLQGHLQQAFLKKNFVFNILKDIIDNENTHLRIEYNWYFAGDGKEYTFEISSVEPDDEYWGTSLLYFALKKKNFDLADYLIIGIEKTTSNPLTNHSRWDTASLINLGFAPDGEPSAKISPLTLVLMKPTYTTHEKQTNKLLAKRLVQLGGKISGHSEYWQTELFEGYVNDPLLDILKEERKLRTKIYEEKIHNLQQEPSDAKEKIKQLEAENTSTEIQPAAKRLKLESITTENANDSINPDDFLTIHSSNFFNKRYSSS